MIDSETKLKLYMLIVNRYKDVISKSEERSISEIRQRCSPYNDFVRKLRDKLIADIRHYEYNKHFLQAVQRAVDYIKSIKNFEFLLTFWMTFEEIDDIKAAPLMDKALLLTALLRSFGCPDAKVYVTRSKKVYVGFRWDGLSYLIDPLNGSILSGDFAENAFVNDPLAYVFNDLTYESFE
jgi:hypothetical protein